MNHYKTDTLDLRLMDCMELMKEYPDKHFDLAIVDPPYFEDYAKANYTGADISTSGVARQTKAIKHWGIPDADYFAELRRVYKTSNHLGLQLLRQTHSRFWAHCVGQTKRQRNIQQG
jgi:DNA modification methylase